MILQSRDASSVLLVAVLALFALGGTSCSEGDSQAGADSETEESQEGEESKEGALSEGEEEEEEEAVPVEVASLSSGSIESLLKFSTNLEALNKVEVLAQASRQAIELLVEEGDEVERGQVLLRLQDQEQQSELARAENELRKARRENDRQGALHEQGLISEKAWSETTFEVQRLELLVGDARRALDRTIVRAPLSGIVTDRQVTLGDLVNMNQRLFDITDFSSIVARVFVPERELPSLRLGLPARVDSEAWSGEAHAGRILRIAPLVDPKTGTVKVTVALPRTQDLRPGMYVDVELITDTHPDAILIPKRALVYDAENSYVFKLVDGRRVEKTVVHVVLENKDFVEAMEPFAVGDEIVIAGQSGLKNASLVQLPGDEQVDEDSSGDDAVETLAEADEQLATAGVEG